MQLEITELAMIIKASSLLKTLELQKENLELKSVILSKEIAILNMEIADVYSKKVAFEKVLREKYDLKDKSSIDLNTGIISQNEVGEDNV